MISQRRLEKAHDMELYAELEIQRRHLLEQKTPEDRAMALAGIDRLLDQLIDSQPRIIETQMPSSKEGQAHLDKHIDMGCE